MTLNDPKIQNMIMRKNLSQTRIKIFQTVFKRLKNITLLTPTELIEEAKEEQTPYIKDDKIVFLSIEDRKISYYFFQFHNHLQEAGLAPKTIKDYLSALRTFYNEYNIELPKPIQIDIEKKIIRKGDIPSIKDVMKAIEYTNNLRNKAIILFLATSGIRTQDMRNFTIGDFVKATKDYHDSNTIHELLEKKRIDNIIPTWYFIPAKTRKKGNICVTFNTPESTEYIINYLRTRKNLNNNDYLFESYNGKLSRSLVMDFFRNLNDKLFSKTQNNERFFHAHSLRKFFISTCNHNSGDLAKVNLLSGHSNKSNVHDTYNEVNTEVMKRFYTKLIPHLSIRDTKVHEYKPADVLKLENDSKLKDEAITNLQNQVDELADKINNIRP